MLPDSAPDPASETAPERPAAAWHASAGPASCARRPPLASRWVPIRQLGRRHAPKILHHLLALSPADRLLRFGHMVSDDNLRAYVASIDCVRDGVFGVFDRKLTLVAMAHLAFGPAGSATGADADVSGSSARVAEFGVSVVPRLRGRSLGARLFAHAMVHARNRGVGQLLIHMARDNQPMRRIVARAGARMEFHGSEGLATLPLPVQTLRSRLAEACARQLAELDFRLKARTRRTATTRPA